MTKDSIFRIYSMTKPIVSVAVMMLVEQGKLLLGDPVAKHLPEYKRQQVMVSDPTLAAPKRPATVQDLLRHTAGLTYEFMGLSAVQRQYAKANISSRGRTNDQFSQALAEIPLMYEPGSVWAYSRATDVLGRLVEVVSGEALGVFLKTHIFDPLGMADTGFYVPQNDHHRIAEPFAHDPDGGVPLAVFDPRQIPAMESGGGGLMSTATDYAQFLRLMQGRGAIQHADGSTVRLLSSATVDYMTSDHLGDIPVSPADRENLLPAGHGFGLGFAVRKEAGVVNTPGSVGQYFWGGIAGTSFFVDPAKELFAIMMIQAPNQRDYYRPLFRNLVYACLVD
jgi:CubicO group peptidase (beta-lactamase class C family)